MSTEQQPPPITLQWFRPQADADGQYSFPPRVQFLAAAWCEPGDCWVYVAGFFEPDGGDEWVLEGHGGRIELADIDWLARLDSGKPGPQQTLPGSDVSQTFPPTISRDDWFPCEPDEDGSYCLHEGMQYLAAMRFFDGPKQHFECVVVTVSYPNGYLALETEDAEIEPTEVAFLALLEGGQ